VLSGLYASLLSTLRAIQEYWDRNAGLQGTTLSRVRFDGTKGHLVSDIL